MLNFFNNKNQNRKEDCYLYKSGVIPEEILEDDNLDKYNLLLQDEKTSDFLKSLIKYFLVPYKISLLKFTLNKEYYENPYPIDFTNNHIYISPSLKKIKKLKENPFNIPLGYPNWFFIAFPDVALWAFEGEGLKLIKNRFKNIPEDELVDGKHISPDLLDDIIKLYQNNTNKQLECKKY